MGDGRTEQGRKEWRMAVFTTAVGLGLELGIHCSCAALHCTAVTASREAVNCELTAGMCVCHSLSLPFPVDIALSPPVPAPY